MDELKASVARMLLEGAERRITTLLTDREVAIQHVSDLELHVRVRPPIGEPQYGPRYFSVKVTEKL